MEMRLKEDHRSECEGSARGKKCQVSLRDSCSQGFCKWNVEGRWESQGAWLRVTKSPGYKLWNDPGEEQGLELRW